jgi:phage terminase large subunit
LYTDKEHARYTYVAPFHSQAKKVAWDYLLRYSAPFRVKFNVAELSVDLFNKSRVSLAGGDNPDALRGLYNDGVALDEPAQMKPRLWPEVIRPSLSDRNGWGIFAGTPQGKNEFWNTWDKAQGNPAWFKLMLKASESGILPQSELDAARLDMDEDEYEQEYECSFDAAIRGSYWGKDLVKALTEGRIGSYPYLPGHKVHTSWDLGYTDDTVIWFFQVIHSRPRFFHCYAASGLEIDDYVDFLYEFKSQHQFEYGEHYLPHDARAHSLQTGKSTQELLLRRKVLARIVPELSVQDGIQATRKVIGISVFDADGCAVGLEAARQYQREWDEDKKAFRQKPRHDWTSHYADGLRMGAIGYREDYNAPQIVLPNQVQKKLISDGVQLNELWKTIPLHRGGRARI